MNIEVISADDAPNETAPSVSRTPISGKSVIYGLAGVVVDECTVVCAGCATDEELDDEADPDTAAIFGDSEWDYPGATCESCHRVLDTRLLVYKDGPGAEKYDELTA